MASTTPRPTGGPSATSSPSAAHTIPPTLSTPVAEVTVVASALQAHFALEDGDWSNANGGHANTRARKSRISSDTIEDIEVAWSVPIPGRGPYGAAAGAPVVQDGVVYLQDLGSNVIAIDLESGEVLWTHSVSIPLAGPNGPAVSDDVVVASIGSSGIIGLNAETGERLWTNQLEKDGFQPVIAEHRVLVGTGNMAHVAGNSGFIHAIDLDTGEIEWSFQVVEEGFWGDPNLNSGGGVWYPPAIDLERGLAYFGAGNAGPYPGTRFFPNGTSREGDNLYTSSIVALDLETGDLEWHYQAQPHGLFDHDFQSSPILATIEVRTPSGTEQRDVAIGSGKLGRVIAVDVETQEVVWDTSVGKHQNDDLTAIPLGTLVEVYPGIFGGVETPMAATGRIVIVPVVNLSTWHSATGHGALDGSSALLNAGERTSLSQGEGLLVAIDVDMGAIIWSEPLDSMPFGGVTVVGDLVFTATWEGVITAHRVTNGEEVWRMHAGGPINAWPAVQDDTILWPIGLGGVPRLIALRLSED